MSNKTATTEEAFVANTFDSSEIFVSLNDSHKESVKRWNLSETRSSLHGRCYTISKNKTVEGFSLEESVALNMDLKLIIFGMEFN